jgi:hypothetical protein
LSILSTRRAYGLKYRKLILGSINFELWNVDKGVIYLSAARDSIDIHRVKLDFLSESKNLRIATPKGNRLEIDGRSIVQTEEKYFLFAIDQTSFRVNPDKLLTIDFGGFVYRFTPMDIALSLRNLYIHGGQLRVRRVPDGLKRPKFMNHGAMVSQYGEPPLLNLVQEIVSGLMTRESIIQATLDFLTEKIAYDSEEFYFGREFLQRSAETLLAGKADCSNKSILLASMLEQLRIEYVLVYTRDHIFVAVPKGDFENQNDLEFEFENRRWTPAETTLRGFRLGKTRVNQTEKLKQLEYIQYPSIKNVLHDIDGKTTIMFS